MTCSLRKMVKTFLYIIHTVFVATYDGSISRTFIGEYEFDANTKNTLLEIAGLLSPYTDTDFD